jgi:2-pyrone-4,6-dicarboxylate lactonase
LIGVVDAHCHVFVDAGVPATPRVGVAAYEPPPVDVNDHAIHLKRSGADCGVLVQPSAYGDDHSCLLAALRRRPAELRGVACINIDTPDAVLREMHELGVRATRVQDGFPGGVPVQSLVEIGKRVAPFGWHVEIWTDVRRHVDWLGDAVRRCPVQVVFDHLGYLPSDAGLDDPGVRLMLALLDEGHAWVALTGLERLLPPGTSVDDPGFANVWDRHEEAIAFRVRACVEVGADHLLWGTDWPHVGVALPLPSGQEIRERLVRWVPQEAIRSRILVDNPRLRYDFAPQ